jgi:hypothetical protein
VNREAVSAVSTFIVFLVTLRQGKYKQTAFQNMRTKEDIVNNWLPRYTGKELGSFGEFILLTNFTHYVETFARWNDVPVEGKDKNWPSATAGGITMINFGMGSPNAATVMDLLSAIQPKAVLFLGKCGGLKKKNKLGDLILPIAAIRSDGTSNDYLPLEIPALPAFKLQSAVSAAIVGTTSSTIPEPSTLQTGVCGNMMTASRNTSSRQGPWPLTWRQPQSLQSVSPTRFPQAPSSSSPTSR